MSSGPVNDSKQSSFSPAELTEQLSNDLAADEQKVLEDSLDQADFDGDGVIDRDEFLEWKSTDSAQELFSKLYSSDVATSLRNKIFYKAENLFNGTKPLNAAWIEANFEELQSGYEEALQRDAEFFETLPDEARTSLNTRPKGYEQESYGELEVYKMSYAEVMRRLDVQIRELCLDLDNGNYGAVAANIDDTRSTLSQVDKKWSEVTVLQVRPLKDMASRYREENGTPLVLTLDSVYDICGGQYPQRNVYTGAFETPIKFFRILGGHNQRQLDAIIFRDPQHAAEFSNLKTPDEKRAYLMPLAQESVVEFTRLPELVKLQNLYLNPENIRDMTKGELMKIDRSFGNMRGFYSEMAKAGDFDSSLFNLPALAELRAASDHLISSIESDPEGFVALFNSLPPPDPYDSIQHNFIRLIRDTKFLCSREYASERVYEALGKHDDNYKLDPKTFLK